MTMGHDTFSLIESNEGLSCCTECHSGSGAPNLFRFRSGVPRFDKDC